MSATTFPNVYHGTLLDEIIHEQKLSRELVKKAAREVFAIIKEGLLRDGVVRINHFGSFKLKRVAARKGRNPKTGEAITIPGRAKVIFTPCQALREMIEPVHAQPIPVPTPVAAAVQVKQPKREEVQPFPEPMPEPALLKIESEASSAIERISDSEEEEQVAESRRGGGREKLIYFGIAAAIIAVVAIKSMPRKVETQPQPVAAPPATEIAREITVVEPIVVTELEIQPAETVSAPVIPESVVDMTAAALAKPELAAEEEVESELAQIIAIQSAQQRVELEVSAEKDSLALEESSFRTEEEAADQIQQPIEVQPISEIAIEEVALAETPAVKQPQVATEFFFTERLYKPKAGNSLWRISRHFYTEPLYWPHIYYANPDTITNPDKLREGRAITVPTLEGGPGSLTTNDREGIAEGYFLVYTFYKGSGHPDAFFALLEAKRYSAEVVERKRHTLTLSKIENIMLDQQEVVANL